MRHETPCDRYRREQDELMKQLDQRRRSAAAAAAWEQTRQRLRQCGVLVVTEARLNKLRSVLIWSERKRGQSLQGARRHADEIIERTRKLL